MLRQETADRWREKSLANLIDRARQTGCWVASADVTGTSGNLVSYGCTAIVTPEGSVVARVPELQEGVAVYDMPSGSAGTVLPTQLSFAGRPCRQVGSDILLTVPRSSNGQAL